MTMCKDYHKILYGMIWSPENQAYIQYTMSGFMMESAVAIFRIKRLNIPENIESLTMAHIADVLKERVK